MNADTLLRPLDVLVVDDEPGIRDFLTTFLQSDGHRATTASNGREGLERFRAGSYDVVVTDCAMPEMFGDKLAEAIKELSPLTPIILITGFGDLMRQAQENPRAVDVILSKPFRLSQFRETLASVAS
jgi:DNA-binding NtrC family response regulator